MAVRRWRRRADVSAPFQKMILVPLCFTINLIMHCCRTKQSYLSLLGALFVWLVEKNPRSLHHWRRGAPCPVHGHGWAGLGRSADSRGLSALLPTLSISAGHRVLTIAVCAERKRAVHELSATGRGAAGAGWRVLHVLVDGTAVVRNLLARAHPPVLLPNLCARHRLSARRGRTRPSAHRRRPRCPDPLGLEGAAEDRQVQQVGGKCHKSAGQREIKGGETGATAGSMQSIRLMSWLSID